jgi:hypothetical protein
MLTWEKRDLSALINLCYSTFHLNFAMQNISGGWSMKKKRFRLIANWWCESFSHQLMVAFLGRKLNYSTRSIISFVRALERMLQWNVVITMIWEERSDESVTRMMRTTREVIWVRGGWMSEAKQKILKKKPKTLKSKLAVIHSLQNYFRESFYFLDKWLW